MKLFGFDISRSSEPSTPATKPGYDAVNVEVGRLQASQQSVPEFRVDPMTIMGRPDRTFFMQDISSYRYNDPDSLLKMLSKYDPDVSAGLWNFLRLLDSGFKVTALDKNMQPDSKLQLKLDQMLARVAGMGDFKNWDIKMTHQQIANQCAKYVLLRGAMAVEMVLGKDKKLFKPTCTDPVTVFFRQPAAGQYIPFQRNLQGQEILLNIPTFFWGILDPDAGSPFETPPFLPAVQAVLFNLSVLQDLQKIVKRTAFPRIKVKIVEEVLRKFAPPTAQLDDKTMSEWLNKQRADLGTALKELKPEDAAVFFDSIDVSMLETQNNATVDYTPLIKVIDQRVITGLKSLPTILGRQFGSSQTLGGVESLLYSKSVQCVQEIVAATLTRAYSFAMQVEGIRGFARCSYGPVTLRPEHEMESFFALKQNRILTELSLGFRTDADAAEQLTGDPTLPKTFKPLSGTGFWEKKPTNLNADAQANVATRDPAGAEATGGGRNTGN